MERKNEDDGSKRPGDRVGAFCTSCEDERTGTMIDNIDMRCDSCGEVVCVTSHEDSEGNAIERVPS